MATNDYNSDFEMSVAEGLRRLGWTVRTQIGVSKFRIDRGVIHPDAAGKFLAGIECDGATYHSSPSARDRDRVRHIILERLGWRDAPADYGPHQTLYNRWFRWSQMGVFARILQELVKQDVETAMIMIDVEPVVRHWSENCWRGHLKAHRTASSLRKTGGPNG